MADDSRSDCCKCCTDERKQDKELQIQRALSVLCRDSAAYERRGQTI